ncbi:uracil-DNA glycosylase [Desulfuromonas acetoxidans]|uniref:uracil-DNA glycosylase n=1 Tax=Desulfuromonas acetoxidans TaxID=891 RepID=UPI00292F0407|nr:uracil-DNA glycosylase [Desulfuromonas acetoxidans]
MALHDPLLPELIDCQRCPRLMDYLATLPPKGGRSRDDYWNRPVPGFGDINARIWLVGLAPGAHGANRTARPFTGDGAGDFMYPLLYQAGLSNQAESESCDDGLRLSDLYISNAVKCVPPGNKPLAEEFHQCRDYLLREWKQLTSVRVILALGRDAFISVLHLLKQQGMIKRLADFPFAHNACFELTNGQYLLACYHTSRYNVQTGRMTEALFLEVLNRARQLAEA